MNRTYSGLARLPRGQASEKLMHGCLVLEGGAFRGLYTQGFLDAMMRHDLNLDCVIGVSAGALSGVNYVSGQIGRSGRINLGYRHDSRYVGLRAFLHSRSLLDIGFLTEDRGILEPVDRERFARPEQRFIAVATNCLTGKPALFEKGVCGDIMLGVRASATMPYISPPVVIGGVPYMDGGCSCSIPYRWAMEQGYEKILVIKTRDLTFRKEAKTSSAALRFYRKWPAFARMLSVSSARYNEECTEVERLHAEGRIFRIAPAEPVAVARVEKDMEKLGALYWQGYHECEELLGEIRAYLGAEDEAAAAADAVDGE